MQASGNKYNLLMARSVIVLTAVIVWIVAYVTYQNKTDKYTQLSSQLNQQSALYTKLNNMAETVKLYRDKFEAYQPISQYENENRLYWLDQLEVIRERHKIPRLNYQVGSRMPYKYDDGLLTTRGITVMVTDVKLSMGLLHAGDLIRVLEDLRGIKSGRHIVTSCDLKHLANTRNRKAISKGANIDASCQLKWFTFKVTS